MADIGTMKRVDVYLKNSKYIFKPEYLLAENRRVNKVIDTTGSVFLFSLNKNDYVRLRLNGNFYEGYFVMYESDGRLNLRMHDQPLASKVGCFRNSVTKIEKIEKFHVDVLGNIFPAAEEVRRGLA